MISKKSLFKNKGSWWIGGILVLLVAATAFYFRDEFGLKDIHTHIASYHWIIVFLLVATLPIFGFSVFICYLVVGLKFGGGWGVAVMALATMVHLAGSHWIATSFLRKRIEAYIAKKKYKLPHVPEGENVSVSLMTSLIPGLPYFVRNYLLALAGIPLKTYFWVCLPIYVVRSVVTIFAADLSANFSGNKFIFLGGIFAVKIGICAYIVKRLRDKSSRKAKRAAASKRNLPV
ncbi:MAG: hypothetical protein ABIR24_10360 [Verrucomicrobiota bacterium]